MPLTFGSDAHSPEEIASDFDRARGTRTSSRIPFRTCVRAAPPCGTAFQITFQHGMARQTAGSPLT